MAIKKQKITGKTPKEIAEMLQIYGDVVSTEFKSISNIIWALDRSKETKIIIIVKGDKAIIGTETRLTK